MKQKVSTEPSRTQLITSSSSVVIALCALSLSFYSACQTRRTAHLSVRPYIVPSFYFTKEGAGYTFENYGQGPAIIRSFEVSLDGQRVESWYDLTQKLNLQGGYNFNVPGPGVVMPPQTRAGNSPARGEAGPYIFWVPSENKDGFKTLTASYSRLRITSCYCSLYEDCWKTTSSHPDGDLSPEEVSACAKPIGEPFKGSSP